MVNVSKRPLKKELAESLSRQFVNLVAKLNKKTTANFLEALLTDAEHIMLIKRLAAVVMLHEGYSAYRISVVLDMSPTTVGDMQERYEEGEYRSICGVLGRSDAEKQEIWKTVGVILRLGLPPVVGEERKHMLNKDFGRHYPKKRKK